MATRFDRIRRTRGLAWLLDNPLLTREIRRRMRGRAFSWSLIGYLITLGGVSCLLMFASYPWDADQMSARDLLVKIGKIGTTLFTGMRVVEFIVAIMIAPMLTAGLATAEKEKDTFDFLRVTTLSSTTFVVGCLLTTACFLLLIFACTLPVLALTFIFGGVSMREIMSFNATLFMASMAISAWGVFNSTNYKRSKSVQGSMVVISVVILFMMMSRMFGQRLMVGGIVAGATSGTPWLAYLGVRAMLAFVTLVFAVAAARKLYEPNNRLFNYKQFTAFYILVMAAVGGTLIYQMARPAANLMSGGDVIAALSLYHFVGGFFMMGAILLFSAGRLEKGDEVWCLRLERPRWRRVHETYALYLFYLLVWLIPVFLMGTLYDQTGEFMLDFVQSLPILMAALALVLALTLGFNLFVERRNMVAVAVLVTLLVVWVLAPIVGYYAGQISPFAGQSQSVAVQMTSAALLDFSPFPVLYRIWDGRPDVHLLGPAATAAAMALVALSPYLSAGLRRRVEISYDWTGAPAQMAEEGAAGADQ